MIPPSMVKNEFLKEMAVMVDQEEGTLTGSEKLEDLEGWSSISMVSFIAFADEQFSKRVSPRDIAAATTVDDLGKLVGV